MSEHFERETVLRSFIFSDTSIRFFHVADASASEILTPLWSCEIEKLSEPKINNENPLPPVLQSQRLNLHENKWSRNLHQRWWHFKSCTLQTERCQAVRRRFPLVEILKIRWATSVSFFLRCHAEDVLDQFRLRILALAPWQRAHWCCGVKFPVSCWFGNHELWECIAMGNIPNSHGQENWDILEPLQHFQGSHAISHHFPFGNAFRNHTPHQPQFCDSTTCASMVRSWCSPLSARLPCYRIKERFSHCSLACANVSVHGMTRAPPARSDVLWTASINLWTK